MAHDVIFNLYSVPALKIARRSRNIQCLTAMIQLDQGDHFRGHLPCIEETTHTQSRLEPQSDLCLHICKLLLYQLRGCQGTSKLLTIADIIPGAMPAILSGSHHAPGNAIARAIETAKWPLQSAGV